MINITLDGVNIQDNTLRSTDGFFAIVSPRLDAIEEVTVTTAAQGADSAQGAAQIKFTTRSGTNTFTGSFYEYYRRDALNANTWFNNRDGVAKAKLSRTSSVAASAGRSPYRGCSTAATRRSSSSTTSSCSSRATRRAAATSSPPRRPRASIATTRARACGPSTSWSSPPPTGTWRRSIRRFPRSSATSARRYPAARSRPSTPTCSASRSTCRSSRSAGSRRSASTTTSPTSTASAAPGTTTGSRTPPTRSTTAMPDSPGSRSRPARARCAGAGRTASARRCRRTSSTRRGSATAARRSRSTRK